MAAAMKGFHTSLSVSKNELGECASALIHTVFFHRDHLAMMVDTKQIREPPLEQECHSVDLAYVVRDQVVKDIVQPVVNDFVTQVRDSRSAKLVLRFFKKDEKVLLRSNKTPWEEWTFDFDIADAVGDPSERKRELARKLGAQMAKISSNCVENMATVPSPEPRSLACFVDRRQDVYWHDFTTEKITARAGSGVRTFISGLFAPGPT
mmetsp:Transcript_17660/g.46072  ORF Transcript_17660/g.46072 Transcript_17660/m.46072 type:complete len:207 (-) Transcript_17660:84-704(-)